MKKIFPAIALLISQLQLYSQNPGLKIWDKRYGGGDWELPTVFYQTLDDGFLLGGYSKSPILFEKSDSCRGLEDYWIVKTDGNGSFLWDKTFGGDAQDILTSILLLPDSGFLLGGYSTSGLSGDKSKPNCNPLIPGADYWIVRIDKNGNKLWDKTYGGDLGDFLTDLIRLPDGSFLLGGYSFSDSTVNMTQHTYGFEDIWILKIDSNGNKLWDRTYGSTLHDQFNSFMLTADSCVLIGGFSNSQAGHSKSQPTCNASQQIDYWTLKIDYSGNKIWDKRIGGPDFDRLVFVKSISDNEYLFCGFSASGIGCEKTVSPQGSQLYQDFWLVWTDSALNIIRDKIYGGNLAEDELDNVKFNNNHILISGTSYSSASGDKTDNNILNMEQAWILELDSIGNKLWDKTIPNPVHTEYCSGLKTKDGCYVFLSMATDSGGDVSQNRNSQYDFWLVKYCSNSVFPVSAFSVSSNQLCQNTCINMLNHSVNATNYQWLFPGGTPSSSTASNPQNICYFNSGTYDISLIAGNSAGTDTFTLHNYLTVFPQVQFAPITQSGDTLFSTAGFQSYQWYYDTTLIPGANNYFYVATQNGIYSIQVTDSNGCTALATLNGVVTSIQQNSGNSNNQINYSANKIYLFAEPFKASPFLKLFDVNGKLILEGNMQFADKNKFEYSVPELTMGVYFINIYTDRNTLHSKFISE